MSKIFLLLTTAMCLFASTELTELLNNQKIGNETLYHPEQLSEIYTEHNTSRLWKEVTRQQELIALFAASGEHGLAPAMFHYKRLLALTAKADRHLQLELDLLLSDAFLHYIDVINYGALDPREFYSIWNLPAREGDITVVFEEALSVKNTKFVNYITHIFPQHFIYQNSQKNLLHYINLQKKIGDYPPIHWSKTLKQGVDAPVIAEIAHRLYLEGDLLTEHNSTLYDSTLEKAVKQYQDRHGLNTDGVIGKGTAKFFKTSIQHQVDKIAINLERGRWVLHHLSDEYIMVNIASYHLYYIKDGAYQFTTPVIVGKKMHETPIFTGKLRYIVYNPTWTVPHSIAVSELLYKAQTRENYLDNFNLELLDHNRQVVDHHVLNFNDYSKDNFPYVFRQKPGNHNALGRIKFLFPNKEAIYLHDTPAKSLFNTDKREFSHGCIRVKNPYILSEDILKNQKMWSNDVKKLESNNEENMITTTLTLKNSIEVLLMYWSAAADQQGKAYFYEDHYHLDPMLLKRLNSIKNPK